MWRFGIDLCDSNNELIARSVSEAFARVLDTASHEFIVPVGDVWEGVTNAASLQAVAESALVSTGHLLSEGISSVKSFCGRRRTAPTTLLVSPVNHPSHQIFFGYDIAEQIARVDVFVDLETVSTSLSSEIRDFLSTAFNTVKEESILDLVYSVQNEVYDYDSILTEDYMAEVSFDPLFNNLQQRSSVHARFSFGVFISSENFFEGTNGEKDYFSVFLDKFEIASAVAVQDYSQSNFVLGLDITEGIVDLAFKSSAILSATSVGESLLRNISTDFALVPYLTSLDWRDHGKLSTLLPLGFQGDGEWSFAIDISANAVDRGLFVPIPFLDVNACRFVDALELIFSRLMVATLDADHMSNYPTFDFASEDNSFQLSKFLPILDAVYDSIDIAKEKAFSFCMDRQQVAVDFTPEPRLGEILKFLQDEFIRAANGFHGIDDSSYSTFRTATTLSDYMTTDHVFVRGGFDGVGLAIDFLLHASAEAVGAIQYSDMDELLNSAILSLSDMQDFTRAASMQMGQPPLSLIDFISFQSSARISQRVSFHLSRLGIDPLSDLPGETLAENTFLSVFDASSKAVVSAGQYSSFLFVSKSDYLVLVFICPFNHFSHRWFEWDAPSISPSGWCCSECERR